MCSIWFVFPFVLLLLPVVAISALSSTSNTMNKKIALITGSNKGIGFEIARQLAAFEDENDGENDDFICILACRSEKRGRAAVLQLEQEGRKNVDFVLVDLEDETSIQSAATYVKDTYGRCDVLINNAAVCFNDPTLYGRVRHTPFDEQADITVRTNFFGTLALTRAMIPLLLESTTSTSIPRIINIASSAGRLSILPSAERRAAFSSNTLTLPELEGYMNDFVMAAKQKTHTKEGWPNTGYGVSKVGIIAMTKILAREYNGSIAINSVDPGYCATDQNNHQGFISAQRGAMTPVRLATTMSISPQDVLTGLHWYEEQIIEW